MAFATATYFAIASLAVGTASYVSAEKSRKEAQANYSASAAEQQKAQSEQRAINSQKAAEERRQQIREERVRIAKLQQAAQATGTSGSSGELGASAGMATQLGANIGSNLSVLAATGRMNTYNQAAADFSTAAQRNLSDMGSSRNLFDLSGTIFGASGGFKQLANPRTTT